MFGIGIDLLIFDGFLFFLIFWLILFFLCGVFWRMFGKNFFLIVMVFEFELVLSVFRLSGGILIGFIFF